MRYLALIALFCMHACYAHENIVLIADPTVLAIPVHENHEPLVDITQQNIIAYGPPPLLETNTNYTKMRKTVYDKLVQAQNALPKGLKFCLYEGYRGIELQQEIFDTRYADLKKLHPKMSHKDLFNETTKFVSPVVNIDGSKNVPPHATGAAIDVYLIDRNGIVVDMGIHIDDAYDDLYGKFCKTDSDVISPEAKIYRKIMSKALQEAGFVNYPTEYWHWSYGDRYWAHQTQQKAAIYGVVKG